MSNDLRMWAYYYGFEETGVPEIDKILSAVACAGKAHHHTDGWGDESSEYPPHSGRTPVDWIQNAANEAAEAWNTRPASVPVEALEQCLESWHNNPSAEGYDLSLALEKLIDQAERREGS